MRAQLPNVVYGSNDGLITTFAVVSGVVGSGLGSQVIVILGIASLLADGFSMGASNYLSVRSQERVPSQRRALHQGAITLVSFVVAGSVPLVSYLIPLAQQLRFPLACTLTGLLLFGIGAGRSKVTKKPWLRSGLEMLLVGALAAIFAYLVGAAMASLTGYAGGSG